MTHMPHPHPPPYLLLFIVAGSAVSVPTGGHTWPGLLGLLHSQLLLQGEYHV